MPDEARREGSLVKSAAAWTTSSGSAAPGLAFRASRPAPEASRAGARLRRPSRRRERPLGAALMTVAALPLHQDQNGRSRERNRPVTWVRSSRLALTCADAPLFRSRPQVKRG